MKSQTQLDPQTVFSAAMREADAAGYYILLHAGWYLNREWKLDQITYEQRP